MKEKSYICPRIIVIKIESEELLELSLGVSGNNYATTGGDAKQDIFDDEDSGWDEEEQPHPSINNW